MSKANDSAFVVAQHVAEAASAPAVKVSAVGTSLVGLGDWLSTGPGIATAIGLCLTLASFLLQLWSVARRDRREQQKHEAEMRSIERGGHGAHD